MSHVKSYQYVLVEEITYKHFTLTVNRLLGEGWKLHGPTQVVCTPNYHNTHDQEQFDTYYYQAMVNLKKKAND